MSLKEEADACCSTSGRLFVNAVMPSGKAEPGSVGIFDVSGIFLFGLYLYAGVRNPGGFDTGGGFAQKFGVTPGSYIAYVRNLSPKRQE